MPKIKVPRKSTVVDMTAMCDVSFLLLTFFILTAKFKPQQLVAVDIPISRSEHTFKNALTIIVDSKGRSFIALNESATRYAMLDQLTKRYGDKYPELTKITDEQKKEFALVDTWGTPIEDMGRVLSLSGSDFKAYQEKQMPGVPYDSLHNQLGDWVQAARYATDGDIKIAIKSDKNTDVLYVKEVVKTLTQRDDVHRFLLITTLSGSGNGKEDEASNTKK